MDNYVNTTNVPIVAARIVLIAFYFIVFLPLMYMLYFYHRYEFHANILHTIIFFCLVLSIQCSGLYSDLTSGYNSNKYNQENCDGSNMFITLFKILIYNGSTAILLAFSVVYLKKNEDMLQGFSKLDYYLKVSIFQKYKDEDRFNREVIIDDERQTVTYRNMFGQSVSSS
jgi:hypothetical protein